MENLPPHVQPVSDGNPLSNSLSNINTSDFLQGILELDFNQVLPDLMNFEQINPHTTNRNNDCMDMLCQVNNNTQLQANVMQPQLNMNIHAVIDTSKIAATRLQEIADENRTQPYIEIAEEPCSNALRFRYACEGRSATAIPGVRSTAKTRTYPAIRVVGFSGLVTVVVSCVTKNPPHRPHPYNLVGDEFCDKGIYATTAHITNSSNTISFEKLCIQCVKKKDIDKALTVREEGQVDPFGTGFKHKYRPNEIDLNVVRLCFQVFIKREGGKRIQTLKPVVSKPIYDRKSTSDLIIWELSVCTGSVAGNTKILVFTEKFIKDDLQVRFFEERDGILVWETLADYQPHYSHKQVALKFYSPPYRNPQIQEPVKVFIQLRRISDGSASEPCPFEYQPQDTCDIFSLKRKRQKYESSPHSILLETLQAEVSKQHELTNKLPSYDFNDIKTVEDGHFNVPNVKYSPPNIPFVNRNLPTDPVSCLVAQTGAPFGNQCLPQYATPCANFPNPTISFTNQLNVRSEAKSNLYKSNI